MLAGEGHGGKVRDPLGFAGEGREGGDQRGGGGGGGGTPLETLGCDCNEESVPILCPTEGG